MNRFTRENILSSEIQQITVQISNSDRLIEASALIDEILKRHHFNNDDYSIVIPYELLKQEEKERRIYNFCWVPSRHLAIGRRNRYHEHHAGHRDGAHP